MFPLPAHPNANMSRVSVPRSSLTSSERSSSSTTSARARAPGKAAYAAAESSPRLQNLQWAFYEMTRQRRGSTMLRPPRCTPPSRSESKLPQNLRVHELQRFKRQLAQLVQMTIVATRRRISVDRFALYEANMKQQEYCGSPLNLRRERRCTVHRKFVGAKLRNSSEFYD